jgi:hypothetical protein
MPAGRRGLSLQQREASWLGRTDPCSGRGPGGKRQEEDLTDLAGAPGGSTDGGGSWQRVPAVSEVQGLALLAAASPTTLVISTGATGSAGTFTARLLVSTKARAGPPSLPAPSN